MSMYGSEAVCVWEGGGESKAKCNPSDLGCGGCAGVKYDAQLLQFIW